jgi:hypothetical protein
MIHVKQKQGAGTCGAVAYAAILHLTELQAIRECHTKMRGKGSGTHDVDLCNAFEARGVSTHRIEIGHVQMSALFWIPLLSTHFPLYVSTSERRNGSQHAIAIANAMVYDGHNDSEVPLELYLDKYVESVIVVDKELETYQ